MTGFPQHQPPHQPPFPSPYQPPSGGGRRFPWLAVLGSIALAVILVVGVGVVLLGRDDPADDERRSESDALRERLLDDVRADIPTTAEAEEAAPGYDYSVSLDGVGTDDALSIDGDYDVDVDDPWKAAPGKIEVYADAALSRPVPVDIGPDLTSPADDPRLAITPLAVRRTHVTYEDGQAKGTLADLGTYWNLNPRVYVVQYLTPEGAPRERPLVTEVAFASATAAPAQIAASVTQDGDAQLDWAPVEGASEYAVVLQQHRGSGLDGTVRVIGRTSETTWTSAETERCRSAGCTQNDVLALTTIDASTMAALPELSAERVDARLGVVAVVDRETSLLAPADLAGLEALPVRSDRRWDAGADVADRGLAALPSRFLFVAADGSTRATGSFVERAEVTRRGDVWEVPLRGQGTRLVDVVRIPVGAVDDIDAQVAAYNERALRDYPPAGLLQTEVVIDVDDPEKPGAELPAPDYPVFGSNELTRFIASQLIAGSTAIDTSTFADRPGLPSLQDAWDEAKYQNPYAFAYFDRISLDGSVIHVDSPYSATEKQSRQKRLAAKVEDVVTSEITDDMSAADKVGALNRYLVDTADYDHAAIAGSPGPYVSDIPAALRYAWEPDGTLLDRQGVCMSYAYAFQALAQGAGLESVVVTGDLADGGGHAWNKVRTGGSWRSVDVTWNDPKGAWTPSTGTRYLMIRDAAFTGPALRSEDDRWMSDAFLAGYATR